MLPGATPTDERHTLLTTRADYIVQQLRANLPPSSLWHEKPFSRAQLESLVIVSTGGMYDVNTFDPAAPGFPPKRKTFLLRDLAISVHHVPETHQTLTDEQIRCIVHEADSEFDELIATDRTSVVSLFRRVTFSIAFQPPTDDIDGTATILLQRVASVLGYQLHYVPYIISELWLPSSEFYKSKEWPQDVHRAAEFIFDPPQNVDDITAHIQTIVQSSHSLRAPGIRGTIPGIEHLQRLNFIGRRF